MDLQERIELTRQTLDALERIKANGRDVPDGFVLEWSRNGASWDESAYVNRTDNKVWNGDHQSFYRLRSTTPRLVPLGPEDIPPGSVVLAPGEVSFGWRYIRPAHNGTHVFVGDVSYTFEDLMRWQIKRPGEDWQPCSKPEN